MVQTTDLYEASYYLLNGCFIDTIQCLPVNGKNLSQFSFEGPDLTKLQLSWFQGNAEVNLLEFRRAYSQINSFSYDAKKKWKQQRRETGGEE